LQLLRPVRRVAELGSLGVKDLLSSVLQRFIDEQVYIFIARRDADNDWVIDLNCNGEISRWRNLEEGPISEFVRQLLDEAEIDSTVVGSKMPSGEIIIGDEPERKRIWICSTSEMTRGIFCKH